MPLRLLLILTIISFKNVIFPGVVSSASSPESPSIIDEATRIDFESIVPSATSSPRFVSPISTVDLMANSPQPFLNQKQTSKKSKAIRAFSENKSNKKPSQRLSDPYYALIKTSPELGTLGDDLILLIADFLEFPFRHFAFLNKGFLNFFTTLRPTCFIYRRFSGELPLEILNQPFSKDLAYWSSLSHQILEGDQILSLGLDIALLKMIPDIKKPILRFLWRKIRAYKNRPKLIQHQHPFIQRYSPITALINGFLQIQDYEMVYVILEEFTEVRLSLFVLLDTNFIEYSAKHDKTYKFFQILSRDSTIEPQTVFNVACKYLAVSFDMTVLMYVLHLMYNENELCGTNYLKTKLNAIIYALTVPETFNENQIAALHAFEEPILNSSTRNEYDLIVRKALALILIALRLGKIQQASDLLSALPIQFHYKGYYECILWTMVVTENYKLFLEFFDQLLRQDPRYEILDLTSLKTAISKTKSREFIRDIMAEFDVSKMFSNNLGGEAVYSKLLHFHLLHSADEDAFLRGAVLNDNLLQYAVYHFKDDVESWERLFAFNECINSLTFAKMISYLLVHHRSLSVFMLISRLLSENRMRFATWGVPDIVFDLEAAKFIFENSSLHEFIQIIRSSFRLVCAENVMSYLIIFYGKSCDPSLFGAFKFGLKDFLLQLNHFEQLKLAQIIFKWSDRFVLEEIRRNIRELSLTIQSDESDRLEFEKSLMTVFAPLLRGFYENNPLGYLAIVPFAYLRDLMKNKPEFITRALLSSAVDQDFEGFLNRVRGTTITVTQNIPKTIPFKIRSIRLVLKSETSQSSSEN